MENSTVVEITSLLEALLPRLHVLVVGPGLGRETHMQAFARLAIQMARENGLYLVLDADALLVVQEDPEIIRGYRKAIITPNVAEFAKICDSLVRCFSFLFPTFVDIGLLEHSFNKDAKEDSGINHIIRCTRRCYCVAKG